MKSVRVLMVAAIVMGAVVAFPVASKADVRVARPTVVETHKPDGSVLFVSRRPIYPSGAGSGAIAAAHWGHWHKVKRYTRAQTRRIISVAYDGADLNIFVAAVLGVAGVPAGVLNAITAIGLNRLARAFSTALDRARRQPAVRMDIGFRCHDIPAAPDPCYPWVQIRPRL